MAPVVRAAPAAPDADASESQMSDSTTLARPDLAPDPDVVEHDDVRPREFAPPVVGLLDEPVRDRGVGVVLHVVLHVVALAADLPREVATERRVERTEQEVPRRHSGATPSTPKSVPAPTT